MNAIEVRGLTRRFGDLTAVDGLTFDVPEGVLFGLVGPDGAGKTTTLRMLGGVLRPSAGDATLGGTSVASDPEGVKHHIAYMSQRFGLYTDLTVRENVEFYADLYEVPAAERPARLERLWHFSGLGPFQDRLAGQLSGGMKQKLSLCSALIHHPRMLLLDEPTFGVDPISRRELWGILDEMVREGVTILLSTAYMDEAERCAKVALLHQGRILALDHPDVLRRALPGRMLAIRPDDERKAAAILTAHPAVRASALFGETIHVRLDALERDWPLVRAALEGAGLVIEDAHEIAPGLEDVFIELVRVVTEAPGHGGAEG